MTTNPSKDYYGVLGVLKNATPEQIKQAYRKLVRENHPDRFTGTRKKYEQTGDPDLLKIIDEKITQANEKTQEINEAYQTLSDPDKRRDYDRTSGSTSRGTPSPPSPKPKPEIVLSTTNLNFGLMTKEDKKVMSFTIDNHGGMPEEIHIDWKTVPTWGELVIEPHPTHTFPIKVTVEVKTEKLATDSYIGRIVVIVDGEEFGVSVSVKVVIPAPAPTPMSPRPKTTVATSPPTPIKAPRGIIGFTGSILMIIMFICLIGLVNVFITYNNAHLGQNVPDKFKVDVLNYKISGLNGYTGPDTVNVRVTNNDTLTHDVWVWAVAWYNTLPSDNMFPQKLTSDLIQTNCGDPCGKLTVGANSSATINLIGETYPDYSSHIGNLVQLCVEIAGIDKQANLINSDNSPQWKLHPDSPGCNPYWPDER